LPHRGIGGGLLGDKVKQELFDNESIHIREILDRIKAKEIRDG